MRKGCNKHSQKPTDTDFESIKENFIASVKIDVTVHLVIFHPDTKLYAKYQGLVFKENELTDAKSMITWLENNKLKWNNEIMPDISESSRLKHFLFFLCEIQMKYGQLSFQKCIKNTYDNHFMPQFESVQKKLSEYLECSSMKNSMKKSSENKWYMIHGLIGCHEAIQKKLGEEKEVEQPKIPDFILFTPSGEVVLIDCKLTYNQSNHDEANKQFKSFFENFIASVGIKLKCRHVIFYEAKDKSKADTIV
jgi:hypothetical protein